MKGVMQLYSYLSGRLRQLGLGQRDLALILNLSEASVSHRMVGRTPWRAHEMYAVLRAIGAEADELAVYFPPQEWAGRTNA